MTKPMTLKPGALFGLNCQIESISRGKRERKRGGAYTVPKVKMAYTPIFRFRLICRLQIPFSGTSRITTSDRMLKKPLTPRRVGRSTHVPGTDLSQIRSRGMH